MRGHSAWKVVKIDGFSINGYQAQEYAWEVILKMNFSANRITRRRHCTVCRWDELSLVSFLPEDDEGGWGNNFRKLPLRSYFLIKRNEILNFIISLQQSELFYLVCDLPLLLDTHRVLRNKWHNRGREMIFHDKINQKSH